MLWSGNDLSDYSHPLCSQGLPQQCYGKDHNLLGQIHAEKGQEKGQHHHESAGSQLRFEAESSALAINPSGALGGVNRVPRFPHLGFTVAVRFPPFPGRHQRAQPHTPSPAFAH